MITRKEYMRDSSRLHHAYYLQFATPSTFEIVKRHIGEKRIKDSTCEHFNDIPLHLWDRLNDLVRDSINQRLKGAANGYEPGKFPWSLSDAVCIAKAVAREIRKET